MLNRFAGFDSRDKDLYKAIRDFFGFTPKNMDLYRKALRHKSAAEAEEDSNERLEFLGDAVLGLVVGEEVYLRYPKRDEGFLTQMRSRIVSRESLNKIANTTGLCELLEVKGNDVFSRNIAGNMFEALAGAIYLDLGFVRCREVLHRSLLDRVDWQELECTETDYKSRLVERCQKKGRPLSFRVQQQTQKQGQNIFVAEVLLDGSVIASGTGSTKKDAEQEASHKAWMLEFNRYRYTTV